MSTVFVNGCFDIIHPGHISLLRYAKSLGDELVVAIDSDRRVRSMKGDDRPLQSFDDRAEILAAIRYVDSVYGFDDDIGLTELVEKVSPEIMVIGSDWKGKTIVGREHAKEVRFFDRIEKYSTTKIVKTT
jgi:D-beta-D-heptose 7-phosphate kinase/D-beta-D-heptose 1-phosphate adenosyltransferase